MHTQSDERPPVGVVPRRQARTIEALMSDAPDTCTVAHGVEAPQARAIPAWSQWLPSVTAVAAVAGALEWLKLTR
jgi:hypothetical protein